jgi:hypothetical protein
MVRRVLRRFNSDFDPGQQLGGMISQNLRRAMEFRI